MNREEALSQKCIQNRDTLTSFRDHLTKPSPKVEWLLKVGPIAKRLNEESTREGGFAKAPASNHGD